MPTIKNPGYTLAHANRQIVMTREFARNTNDFERNEQDILAELLQKFPTYIAVTKTIAKGTKQSYKGLTIDYMRTIIQETEGVTSIAVKMFNEIVRYYQTQNHYGSYPLIKKWFLDRYKDALPHPENVEAAA